MESKTVYLYEAYGRELHFISRILRDGSGVQSCVDMDLKFLDNEVFKLHRLSLSQNTWIAHGFNSYIVKLK